MKSMSERLQRNAERLGVTMFKQKKVIEFQKYSSLENAHRQKFIDHCHELGIDQWVALEKVHGCFEGKTKITLPDGSYKTIREIVKERFCGPVLGVDSSGNLVETEVKGWFENGKTDEWVKVTFQTYGGKGGRRRSLICTPEHKFFNGDEYIKMGDLDVGDEVEHTYSALSVDPIQKQILIGKMLGDGCLANNSVSFGHKEEHEPYVSYTEECLGGLCGNRQKSTVSGYGTRMVRTRTISSEKISELFADWNKSEGVVPRLNLTPLILAFWYMDDGSLSVSDKQNNRPIFATCGFSRESCVRLVDSLSDIGILATATGDVGRYRVSISSESSDLFYSMIAPFVPEIMQYKLPEVFRLGELTHSFVASRNQSKMSKLTKAVILSKEKIKQNKERYDIETGTHNYFANNIHVHNCNFSFIVDEAGDVTPAKRTSVIGKNAHGSYEFYGCNDVVNEYAPKVRELAERIGGPVVVYGELYGQGIQKEIDYGKKDFIAFDIMTKDDEFLLHDDVVALCNEVGIPTTPEVGRGSLEDMLSISPEINSIVAPGEQTAEGLVIKPLNVDARLGNGSRAIIKNKSKAFSEKKDRTPKKPFKLPDSVKPLFDDFCQYLNENRLNNVLSKIGKVTQKDFGMVTGALIQDAKDEFERDEYEIAKDDWKLIAKSVGKEASNVVRSQWLNILDKEN